MIKIIIAVKTATLRLQKSWKGILIVWFSSLIPVILVALPLKASFDTLIGKSMITEKLIKGINIEVFADMGVTFTSLLSSFSTGFFISILAAFILNAFLTGGLFNSLKGSANEFSAREFFSASAVNFWPFLVVSLIITFIILGIIMLVIFLPILLVSLADPSPEGAYYKTIMIVLPVFLLILAIMLLVADYARAWLVSDGQNSCFKAIGFGFAKTFRTFFSSYTLMIILLAVQILYGWLVLTILPAMKPATGGTVFLLFLLSQILFFIKILLKVWRYGAVTSLMEQNF
jgi:hypothetical protein